jgi:predicted nucleic acid-binding protein
LAGHFFDSSALAKLYHAETGTPEVENIVRAPGAEIWISRLTVLELPSVFAIKVRTQFIGRDDARMLLRRFQDDLLNQKFRLAPIREPEFESAERLMEQYAFDLRLRTLDALQLAVALGLRSRRLVDHFVAADRILCEVAALEAFTVLNPELF